MEGTGLGGGDWQPADADTRTTAIISHEAVRPGFLACAGVIFQFIFSGFLCDSTRLESVNSRRNRNAVTVHAKETTALHARLYASSTRSVSQQISDHHEETLGIRCEFGAPRNYCAGPDKVFAALGWRVLMLEAPSGKFKSYAGPNTGS